jgi:hypothetical protein
MLPPQVPPHPTLHEIAWHRIPHCGMMTLRMITPHWDVMKDNDSELYAAAAPAANEPTPQ